MIVLGIPVTSEVIIRPNTPNCIIKMYPIGKPMAAETTHNYHQTKKQTTQNGSTYGMIAKTKRNIAKNS
jgi:hypothetical protein